MLPSGFCASEGYPTPSPFFSQLLILKNLALFVSLLERTLAGKSGKYSFYEGYCGTKTGKTGQNAEFHKHSF
jgi:hypothetical protein